ncbi:MAG: PQQ-binding-like beta-propeller repeat protein [Bacteroidales bacterium]|nr:PQQ-binding-like beta-propeller repeat protein [Bacteroidales bacterium]
MKKVEKLFMVIILMAIVLTSCDKNNNPIIPDPDPTSGSHPVLWSYDIGVGGISNITPAVDENNNVYFSMVSEDWTSVFTIALDKNGNELWKNEVTGVATNKVTYAGGKVFVVTDDPVAIYCIEASSGNTNWTKDMTAEYDFEWMPMVAVNNNKVYLSTGQFFYGYLLALDFDGNELWIKQGPTMGGSLSLSVFGNELYFNDGDVLFRYDDNGNSCDSVWAYELSTYKQSRGINGYLDMFNVAFGSDGNLYVRSDTKIEIISRSGQSVNEFDLGESFTNSYSSIILSPDNEVVVGNGNLVKYNHSGILEWETDINDGWLVNPTFTNAPVLSSNGNFYDGQLFGLYSVKSNGTLNWKENAETEAGIEYGNLHPPVFTHEGNIISVSSEQRMVRCFKGDGSGLATSGWPKIYGDYGNTSAR